MSQLIRICNVNTELNKFLEDIRVLGRKLCRQGFNPAALRKILLKFYHSKIDCWGKFGLDLYRNLISCI